MSDDARSLEPLNEQELNDAKALLDNEHFWDMVAEHWGGPAKESGSRLFATIDALLAQPQAAREAAVEAVYAEALRRFDGLVDAAVHGQFDELRASWVQDAIRKALVGTSPAATALLAQGENAVRILERVAAEVYGDWCGHCRGECLPCDVYYTLHRLRGEPFKNDPRALSGEGGEAKDAD